MDTMEEVPLDLVETARSDPEAVDLEQVEELLDEEWEELRNTALKALIGVAVHDTERVLPFVDDVLAALEDPYALARSHAAMVLAEVAEDHPELVEPGIPALVAMLDDPTPLYRYRPARVIATLSYFTPESFVEYTDTFVDALVEVDEPPEPPQPDLPKDVEHYQKLMEQRHWDALRSDGTREVAANVLVEICRVDPDVGVEVLPDVLPAMSDEHVHVRGAIIDLVSHVAEHDTDAVDEAIEPLVERLDDGAAFVRGRAIRALGFAVATEAIEDLRRVAEEDDEERVRELAAETVAWLESTD